jgi:LysM repeat protein
MNIKKLKDINGLRSNKIILGHKLLVKIDGDGYSPSAKVYRVRKGDNLSSIAKKFKTTVRKLKKLNSLKKSIIHPGQIINIRS